MRVPGLCLCQSMVFSLQFIVSPQREFSFRAMFLYFSDLFRSPGVLSYSATSGRPFLLPVSTMTGNKASFQGFWGHQWMSVPRMTSGVPRVICGSPRTQAWSSRANQHAREDPRPEITIPPDGGRSPRMG